MLAITPDAGINLAIKHQPDLVLLDIDMPGISGIEVAQMLRREPRTETIPIIFLSAYDTELEKRRAQELAAADFLAKPCSFKELQNAVEGVLLTSELAQQQMN